MINKLQNRVLLGVFLAACAPSCSAGDEVTSIEESAGPAPADADFEARRDVLLEPLREDSEDPSARVEIRAFELQHAGLLWKLEVNSGHSIYVLEPTAGEISYFEQITNADASILGSAQGLFLDDVSSLFRAVRPDEPLPSELEQAAERQRQVKTRELDSDSLSAEPTEAPQMGYPASATEVNPLDSTSRLTHVTGDSRHFRDDQHGCPTNANASSSFCWTARSGNWRESRKATEFFTVIAMFSGNLLTWTTMASTNGKVLTVFPGEMWSYAARGPLGYFEYLPRTFGAEIRDAEAFVDMWHWGGMWSNAELGFDPNTWVFPVNN